MEDRSVAPPAAGARDGYAPTPSVPGAPGAREAPDLALAAERDGEGAQPELEALLRDDPTSFDFFQAVRLLRLLRPGREPVGRFRQPSAEVARFAANLDTAFPASQIQALTFPPDRSGADGLPQMLVNFMGLTGPLGVLPAVYTRHVADRVRARDAALRDFLDLFHHRIVSLFYRAWEKYRFAVVHERGEDDPVSEHLRDLIGVGTGGLAGRLPLPDEALLFYSGLLGMQPRSAQALEQLIADYFEVPVSVQQFVGAWYPLTVPSQCRLGEDVGAAGQLGLGAVAGDEVWDVQSRVRLRLGPIPRHRYERFLPGGSAHEPLRALVRFFSDDRLDFDVQLVLEREDVPGCVLGEEEATAPPLGWCTWLRSVPLTRDPDDTVLDL